MQISTMAQQMAGEVPGLPPLLARVYVQRAVQEVVDEYAWSWNIQEGIHVVPALVKDGSVSVVKFSQFVTFDATAQTVLLAITLATPALIERQFRVGSSGTIYNILAYDTSTGIATLDRIYTETTNATAGYSIYKCYYGPPSIDGVIPNTDFLRYLTVNDPATGYTISGRRLNVSRVELNRRDPQRASLGNPWCLSPYRPIPNGLVNGILPNGPNTGQMQYELWPHPVTAGVFVCQFAKQYAASGAADYFPHQSSEALFYFKAMDYAYRWAMSMSRSKPELSGIDWRFLISDNKTRYQGELVTSKRQDQEISVSILRPGSDGGLVGPLDSKFAQSHDSPAWIDAY